MGCDKISCIMKNAVIGIIWNTDRTRVIAIHRRDIDIWVLPGGGIEENETPEEAILREVEEETGLKSEIIRKVGEYTPINRLASLTHLYECRIISGHLTVGDESRAVEFISIEQLPNNFFPLHYDWIKDARLNHQDIIYKPIDQITYGLLFKYLLRHPIKMLRYAFSRFGFPLNR